VKAWPEAEALGGKKRRPTDSLTLQGLHPADAGVEDAAGGGSVQFMANPPLVRTSQRARATMATITLCLALGGLFWNKATDSAWAGEATPGPTARGADREDVMEPNQKWPSTRVVSLDGEWLLAPDPQNVGREQQWFAGPRPEAKRTKVPWIIQDAFPGYHGVAWYWREFESPGPHSPAPSPAFGRGGEWRYLLRFWAVDYLAEVWLNGLPVGGHEGGETPFVLDVTDAIKPGENNRLAVRVLNPTHEPMDGIVLNETPHRNKVIPYTAGASYNHGGIVDSVELLITPAVRVEDLFVRPDPPTGTIHVQANVRHAGPAAAPGRIEFSVAPAASGETLDVAVMEREFPVGDTLVEAQLHVDQPRRWELNDPFLYRVTARVWTVPTGEIDERSVRCGFRDFRFEDGYFRLNGRRIYLRSSHTGNHCPIGLQLPHDPDLLRRDLLNVKVMGFNMIRFIAGVATRAQLDLCDEIGLLVYEESYASWCLADSPRMAERYDESVLGMVRRDRNHPSVVIWGLLNETPDGPVFRHAVSLLPTLRALDDSRLVLLNSGRWDDQPFRALAGLEVWRTSDDRDPNVTHNGTARPLSGLGITWAPGQLALHPGPKGEYSVARWTAPADGAYQVAATFTGIAQAATTDVHVLHNGQPLYDGFINVEGQGNESSCAATLQAQAGDPVDFVIGFGNGHYGGDTTALAATLQSQAGQTWDAAADFSVQQNPNGVWSYGYLSPGESPDVAAFQLYPVGETLGGGGIGSLSNPGSTVWEDVLSDQHPYQRVPHTAGILHTLRTLSGPGPPVFLSEYGIGSAVDLWRTVRHYERLGQEDLEDAQFYRDKLDRFLADWEQWNLAECFAGPEDFFAQSLQKMAGQRLLGLNAIRSNPNVVGYSLTGTVDQGMTGEGLFTTFRELKPGTVDALFDGLAPLRWCLFVEPVHVYRGTTVRLEAVLANEDALPPGDYPVRLQVVGPNTTRVFEHTLTVTIPSLVVPPGTPWVGGPMVLSVFTEDVPIDGPSGKYRFLATFERGAAAAGGETEFYVTDPADLPPVETEVVLWGEDKDLARWLADHGIRSRLAFPPYEGGAGGGGAPTVREVILVSNKPAGAGGADEWRELARRIAQGSTAIFLSPEVFAKGDQPLGWLPLIHKGTIGPIPSWLYLKDEWAKNHPIFEGLPSGGLLDYTFYRELIPDAVWSGQDPPVEAVAGAIKASQDYSSGLLMAVYNLGAGRFILNSLLIRENLGTHPAADRLLRNLLRYAGREAGRPLADRPPDFDEQLEARGYGR